MPTMTMIPDYLDVQNMAAVANMADPAVALDFLLTVKTGIRNTAVALTEMANPVARKLVHTQLDQAIDLHEELTTLMVEKGWFRPYDINEQLEMDVKMAQMTLTIAGMELFPETTLGRKYEL